MYYGELKEKSQDYIEGHIVGGERALSMTKASLIRAFEKTDKITENEVISIVQNIIDQWEEYVRKTGLAED